MKIFKHRNLMGCIYALLMAVPLFSILGRTCYSIFNKNAYESYSKTNTITEMSLVQSTTLVDGVTYEFVYKLFEPKGYGYVMGFSETNFPFEDYNLSSLDYKQIGTYSNANMSYIALIDNTNITTLIPNIWGNDVTNFYVIYDSSKGLSHNTYNGGNQFVYTYSYRPQTLDNAFDYSLSKFVNDNDFGRLNFFQWFWDIFLTNNQQNNLYIHFVNWYMNYALCVSSAYILFLVLMWFINYSRRILERGMNYDW